MGSDLKALEPSAPHSWDNSDAPDLDPELDLIPDPDKSEISGATSAAAGCRPRPPLKSMESAWKLPFDNTG